MGRESCSFVSFMKRKDNMVARRIAVIDIGSNSVRMMVADVGGEA